jgi:hypothetical protein
MPWTVADPMLERARLIAAHLDGLYAVSELVRVLLGLAGPGMESEAGGRDFLPPRSQEGRLTAPRWSTSSR